MVTHRSFVELVGRLVYAGQVLVWMKPLMAPLHAWKSAVAAGTAVALSGSGDYCAVYGWTKRREPRAIVGSGQTTGTPCQLRCKSGQAN